MEEIVNISQCSLHKQPIISFCLSDTCKLNNSQLCEQCIQSNSHLQHQVINRSDLCTKLSQTEVIFKQLVIQNNLAQQFKNLINGSLNQLKNNFSNYIIKLEQTINNQIDKLSSDNLKIKKSINRIQYFLNPQEIDKKILNNQQFYSQLLTNSKNNLADDSMIMKSLISLHFLNKSYPQQQQTLDKYFNNFNLLFHDIEYQISNFLDSLENNQIFEQKFDIELFKGQFISAQSNLNSEPTTIEQLNQKKYCSGHKNGQLQIWNIGKNKLQKNIQNKSSSTIWSIINLKNNVFISGGQDNTISLWNWQKGQLLRQLKGHTAFVRSILYLNKNEIISCSDDKSIKIWNLNTGKNNSSWQAHQAEIKSICLLNQNQLVSVGRDQYLHIWNIKSQICEKSVQTQNILYASQKINDFKIACSTIDGHIIIFNIPDLQQITVLYGHQDCVFRILTLDNDHIASCSQDGTVLIWNISQKLIKMKLRNHQGQVCGLSKFGKSFIISSSSDKSIKIIK